MTWQKAWKNPFAEGNMRIIPKDKFDFEACERLDRASDDEVQRHLPQLLEWLQDINWPVAPRIVRRLSSMGDRLVEPVKAILRGDDGMWKYWIISMLVSVSGETVIVALEGELSRLVAHPSENDVRDEVDIAAKELLARDKR